MRQLKGHTDQWILCGEPPCRAPAKQPRRPKQPHWRPVGLLRLGISWSGGSAGSILHHVLLALHQTAVESICAPDSTCLNLSSSVQKGGVRKGMKRKEIQLTAASVATAEEQPVTSVPEDYQGVTAMQCTCECGTSSQPSSAETSAGVMSSLLALLFSSSLELIISPALPVFVQSSGDLPTLPKLVSNSWAQAVLLAGSPKVLELQTPCSVHATCLDPVPAKGKPGVQQGVSE
ncbi:hypothetical protein AAY473_014984 [Plecturocebus cupreus]